MKLAHLLSHSRKKKKILTSKGFKSNSNNNSLQKNKEEFHTKEKKS